MSINIGIVGFHCFNPTYRCFYLVNFTAILDFYIPELQESVFCRFADDFLLIYAL